MVYLDQDSAYMKLLKPFLEKKKVCGKAPIGMNAQRRYQLRNG
jgi:hypothetical protein